MPVEVAQTAEADVQVPVMANRDPIRRPSLFRRIFRIPEAVAETDESQMTEYVADAWLVAGSPAESEPQALVVLFPPY